MMKKCGRILFFLGWCYAAVLHAEIVDTYQFNSATERTRAVALAKSLRCPQCQNQNLVESNSPIAYDLRLEVYQMVSEGKTDQQIIEQMTEHFGYFVLYQPPLQWKTLLLWFSPLILLVLACLLLWRYMWQRLPKTAQTSSRTVLNEQEQQALERLLTQYKKDKEK